MDRSLFWVDRRRLAEALDRAGLGGGASRGKVARPSPPDTARAPQAPGAAARSGPASSPPPPPAFQPPEGTFAARLRAYGDWVVRETGCRSFYLIDRDGLPLIEGQESNEGLGLGTMTLGYLDLLRSRHGARAAAGIALRPRSGGVFYLFRFDTAGGTVCLGFGVPGLLPVETLTRIEEAFEALRETAEAR